MRRRRFYGWYLVVGLGVTTIVSSGISQYLFGVLVVPIQHDLHWSRATISGAFSLGLVVSALLGLVVGRLVDRYGARTLMSAGSILGAVTLFLLSRVTEVWQFYLPAAGCLGVAMALSLYPAPSVVLPHWFQGGRGPAAWAGGARVGGGPSAGAGGIGIRARAAALAAVAGGRSTRTDTLPCGSVAWVATMPFTACATTNASCWSVRPD